MNTLYLPSGYSHFRCKQKIQQDLFVQITDLYKNCGGRTGTFLKVLDYSKLSNFLK